jgi:hypothetical protein
MTSSADHLATMDQALAKTSRAIIRRRTLAYERRSGGCRPTACSNPSRMSQRGHHRTAYEVLHHVGEVLDVGIGRETNDQRVRSRGHRYTLPQPRPHDARPDQLCERLERIGALTPARDAKLKLEVGVTVKDSERHESHALRL